VDPAQSIEDAEERQAMKNTDAAHVKKISKLLSKFFIEVLRMLYYD